MRLIFFGTPDYVLPILTSLHKEFSLRGVSPIVAVVTQPPRPSGREQRVTYSPIDSWAFKKKVPIFYSSRNFINSQAEADLGILAAYGEIIPEFVINHLKFGILNIHPSLLPKWRGASPVQATILSGEKETGISIIRLDEKLDHGPIVSQFREEILETDTAGTLRARLFERSAEVLVELIEPYLKGKITPREQNHDEATFTRIITKDDAFIPPEFLRGLIPRKGRKTGPKEGSTLPEWKILFIENCSLMPTANCLDRFIRAMMPWPVAWTHIQLTANSNQTTAKRLKILKAHVEKLVPSDYSLVPDLVQLEGKNPVSWKQFSDAYPNAFF